MRKMDSVGLKTCGYQARLFEKSIDAVECSSRIFVRRFLNSKLARRMDSQGFLYESVDISDAIEEVEIQYGPSSYGIDKYSVEEMHWIGYIYRYWAYVTERSSKHIYKLVKPEELRKLYFPYHSLDPMQAIERIAESKGIELYVDIGDIERGVQALRKVRNKHKHGTT